MSSLLLTTLDTGNTAWMIMATILVLLMSIPGIALFYGGLVRQKNILSILMQTIFIVAVVSLIWVASVIPGLSLQNMPIRAILWLASSAVSISASSTASAWMHHAYRHSGTHFPDVPVRVCLITPA